MVKKYIRNRKVSFKNLNSSNTIILSEDKKYLYELDEVASLLWSELKIQKTEESLTKKIVSDYEIDEKTAKKDVTSFIEENVARGLLKQI